MKTKAPERPSVTSNIETTNAAISLADNRPQTSAQQGLQNLADTSPQTLQQKSLADQFNQSFQTTAQRQQQQLINQHHKPVQKKPNDTGLSDNLKSGIESLSGVSMDNVKVHYNSAKPAQMNAHAYAQGTDIHVAAGQEKHLPHEAWHVVQQAQGRVQPTTQVGDGVPVNDDSGLEQEADVMGTKALQTKSISTASNTQSHHNSQPITQYKRSYINGGDNHMTKAWALVQKFEETQEIPVEKRLNHSEFVYGITGLTVSELDYGVIDLDSDQQVGLLYYDIRKQAEDLSGMDKKDLRTKEQLSDPKRAEQIEKGKIGNQEKNAKLEKEEKKKSDDEYMSKSPNPEMTFEVAILGAGAATAYYLTSKGDQINPAKTIVIGTVQPWAGLRGPGVINHPEHMISALRDEVGLKDEQLMDRQAFSDSIEIVINKRVRNRLQEKVKAVDKIAANGAPFYKIELDNGTTYYAKNVVAGLGIGPHMNRVTKEGSPDDKRIMDMDTFQREADRISTTAKNPGDITVFIVGGNAAIDVVQTSITKGFKIIWYPGDNDPAFLQGTDNEIVEEEYDKYAKREASKIFKYVKKRAGAVGVGTNKALKIEGQEADYYTYGQGPNVKEVSKIFNKENILDKLETKKDINHFFGGGHKGGGDGAALGLQMPVSEDDPTSLEIIGGSAFRMATPEQSKEFQGVINSLPNNVVGNDQLAPIRAQVEAAEGFVPSYVEDDVNMAVDNITVIAIHIAVKYPNLSEEDANMWADRIIRWRRPSPEDIEKYKMLQGPIPNPHAKPRENARSFSEWFKKRLSEENEKAKKK